MLKNTANDLRARSQALSSAPRSVSPSRSVSPQRDRHMLPTGGRFDVNEEAKRCVVFSVWQSIWLWFGLATLWLSRASNNWFCDLFRLQGVLLLVLVTGLYLSLVADRLSAEQQERSNFRARYPVRSTRDCHNCTECCWILCAGSRLHQAFWIVEFLTDANCWRSLVQKGSTAE